MAQLISVRLQRSEGQPWGFRLQGGKDFGTQLVLQKVNVGSIADKAGLIAGDAVIRVNNEEVFNLRHKDAQDVILRGGNSFELTVSRGGSTWRPSVTPLTSPVPTPTGVQVLTKTSLAANARTPTPNIGSGHNTAARPFGGNNNLVNKQFNSPIQCYNEQTIAETISAQSEILAGGAIGVNFKKNEKQFNPEQSAVLRALQESDNEPEPEPTSEVYSSPSFAPSSTPSSVTRHVSAPANVPVPKPSNGLPPGQNICADCERLIVGVFVRIKDKNLHVECFKCATCGTSLKNQGYYHLNNKLYCDIHARLAALNSPPPNTNGQVPVAIPPKTSASTISSALSSHVNNLSLNGSSLPASFAPPAAPAAVPTTDITPTHSRDSSVSSGYGKSCSPTPSPLDSESGIDEAVPSPYGSLFFKTSNGKIIRSVRPPSKDGTNFYKDKFAPSNGPRPFAQSAPAPAALAPKSPVAYPPPGPPTWAAPEPAAAPAPAPAAAPVDEEVLKDSKTLLLKYIREDEGREALKDFKPKNYNPKPTPGFQWPPKPKEDETEVPLAAPIYVPPPETQHAKPKPMSERKFPQSVQSKFDRNPSPACTFPIQEPHYLDPEVYSSSTSNGESSEEYQVYSMHHQPTYASNVSQQVVRYYPPGTDFIDNYASNYADLMRHKPSIMSMVAEQGDFADEELYDVSEPEEARKKNKVKFTMPAEEISEESDGGSLRREMRKSPVSAEGRHGLLYPRYLEEGSSYSFQYDPVEVAFPEVEFVENPEEKPKSFKDVRQTFLERQQEIQRQIEASRPPPKKEPPPPPPPQEEEPQEEEPIYYVDPRRYQIYEPFEFSNAEDKTAPFIEKYVKDPPQYHLQRLDEPCPLLPISPNVNTMPQLWQSQLCKALATTPREPEKDIEDTFETSRQAAFEKQLEDDKRAREEERKRLMEEMVAKQRAIKARQERSEAEEVERVKQFTSVKAPQTPVGWQPPPQEDEIDLPEEREAYIPPPMALEPITPGGPLTFLARSDTPLIEALKTASIRPYTPFAGEIPSQLEDLPVPSEPMTFSSALTTAPNRPFTPFAEYHEPEVPLPPYEPYDAPIQVTHETQERIRRIEDEVDRRFSAFSKVPIRQVKPPTPVPREKPPTCPKSPYPFEYEEPLFVPPPPSVYKENPDMTYETSCSVQQRAYNLENSQAFQKIRERESEQATSHQRRSITDHRMDVRRGSQFVPAQQESDLRRGSQGVQATQALLAQQAVARRESQLARQAEMERRESQMALQQGRMETRETQEVRRESQQVQQVRREAQETRRETQETREVRRESQQVRMEAQVTRRESQQAQMTSQTVRRESEQVRRETQEVRRESQQTNLDRRESQYVQQRRESQQVQERRESQQVQERRESQQVQQRRESQQTWTQADPEQERRLRMLARRPSEQQERIAQLVREHVRTPILMAEAEKYAQMLKEQERRCCEYLREKEMLVQQEKQFEQQRRESLRQQEQAPPEGQLLVLQDASVLERQKRASRTQQTLQTPPHPLHTRTPSPRSLQPDPCGLHHADNIPRYQRKWYNLPTQRPSHTPEPRELIENVPLAFVATPKEPSPQISKPIAVSAADTLTTSFARGSQQQAEPRYSVSGQLVSGIRCPTSGVREELHREMQLVQVQSREEQRYEASERIEVQRYDQAQRQAQVQAQVQAQAQAEEAARRQAEEASRRQAEEAARRQAEEAARRQAEEAARRQAEEAARRQAEEAARRQAEEAARRQAEEASRRQAEEASRRQAEEASRRQAEEAARRQAEEFARRQAHEEDQRAREAQRQVDENARQAQAEETRRQQFEEQTLRQIAEEPQKGFEGPPAITIVEPRWRTPSRIYLHEFEGDPNQPRPVTPSSRPLTPMSAARKARASQIPYYQEQLAWQEGVAISKDFEKKLRTPSPHVGTLRPKSPNFGPPPNPLQLMHPQLKDGPKDLSGKHLSGIKLLSPMWEQQNYHNEQIGIKADPNFHHTQKSERQAYYEQPQTVQRQQVGDLTVERREQGSKLEQKKSSNVESKTTQQLPGGVQVERRTRVVEDFERTQSSRTVEIQKAKTGSLNIADGDFPPKGFVAQQARRLSSNPGDGPLFPLQPGTWRRESDALSQNFFPLPTRKPPPAYNQEKAAAKPPLPRASVDTNSSRRWENRQTAIKKLDAMLQARLKFNSKEPLSTPPTPTKPLNAMPLIKVEEEDLPPPPLPKSLPPIEDACLDVTLPDDLPLPPPPPEEPVSKPTPKFLTVKRILPPDYRPQKGVDKENNNNTLNLKNFASKTFETEKPLIETHQASTEEPICSVCDTKIQRGPFITALGRIWCPEHFICVNADCKRPLADIGFVEEKGDLYCEYCFEQYLAPSCKKCNRKIKGDCLNAIGKQFHPECFTCQYCGKLFGNSPFFLEEGEPYCEADWNELFTTKCFACGFPVEAGDRWVEALNNNYHSQCFNCTMCKKNLEGQSFYAKAGRPFCKNHAR